MGTQILILHLKWGISSQQFCIIGRQFFDNKIFGQAEIKGPPCSPCHDDSDEVFVTTERVVFFRFVFHRSVHRPVHSSRPAHCVVRHSSARGQHSEDEIDLNSLRPSAHFVT